jgi:hypothetical protein
MEGVPSCSSSFPGSWQTTKVPEFGAPGTYRQRSATCSCWCWRKRERTREIKSKKREGPCKTVLGALLLKFSMPKTIQNSISFTP